MFIKMQCISFLPLIFSSTSSHTFCENWEETCVSLLAATHFRWYQNNKNNNVEGKLVKMWKYVVQHQEKFRVVRERRIERERERREHEKSKWVQIDHFGVFLVKRKIKWEKQFSTTLRFSHPPLHALILYRRRRCRLFHSTIAPLYSS